VTLRQRKTQENKSHLSIIRALVREILAEGLNRSVEDSFIANLTSSVTAQPGRKTVLIGTSLVAEASLIELNPGGLEKIADVLGIAAPFDEDDGPYFIVKVSHDFNYATIIGSLIVNNAEINTYEFKGDALPIFISSILTLSDLQSAVLTANGVFVKGPIVSERFSHATVSLESLLDLDNINTSSSYVIDVKIDYQTPIVTTMGGDMRRLPGTPGVDDPVMGDDVIANPSKFKISLGDQGSRYSKEPYLRWCPPKEEEPDCNPMRPHYGIDITRTDGTSLNAPIVSPDDGTIVSAADTGGAAGNEIVIQHTDKSYTRFMHLNSFEKGIAGGKPVFGGDVIGYLGKTGRASGPHLHFETYEPGKPPPDGTGTTDPIAWLSRPGIWFPVTAGAATKHNKK
jgi:murein DD-endopeptidase MepM/ murein hydrolase activator NlpD